MAPSERVDRLYLLIPTRESPKKLVALLDSVDQTARHPELLDVWIYIDDDDRASQALIESGRLAAFPFKVHPCVLPRPKTMGDIHHALRERCGAKTGVYVPLADDYAFGTLAWDDEVRDSYWAYPDHLTMCFPVDPTVTPGQVTFPFVSVEWCHVLGRLCTKKFSYWFDDSWADQIAAMVQRKTALKTVLIPPEGRGKTRRMRNLPFWQGYFNCTFHERIADADKIRRAIWGQQEDGFRWSRAVAETHYAAIGEPNGAPDAALLQMEQSLSSNWGEDHAKIADEYWQAEQRAIRELRGEIDRHVVGGDLPRALGMLATIGKAYRQADDSAALFSELTGKYPEAYRGRVAETQYRPMRDPAQGVLTALPAPSPRWGGPPTKADLSADKERRAMADKLGRFAFDYLKGGRPELAEGLLAAAVSIDPSGPELNHGRSIALANLGRLAEAVQAAERELVNSPGHAGATSVLGQLRAAMG